MIIMQDALPGVNRFLKGTELSATATRHVVGFLVAFVMHIGRMSAVQAAAAIRIQPRHRAQVMRFLAKQYAWSKDWCLLNHVTDLVLAHEARQTGRWLLVLDQTYCTHQGEKTENTFDHGQRPKSGKCRRHRKNECVSRH